MAAPARIAEERLEKAATWGQRAGYTVCALMLIRMIAWIVVGDKRENLLIPASFGSEGVFFIAPLMVAALSLVRGSDKMSEAIGWKNHRQTSMHEIHLDDTASGYSVSSNPYNESRLYLGVSVVFFAMISGFLLGNPHPDAGKITLGILAALAGAFAAGLGAAPAVVNKWRGSPVNNNLMEYTNIQESSVPHGQRR
ncbi:MAG: hypothetical protein ACHQAX_01780 [Gammaproteobacteria bacterium]